MPVGTVSVDDNAVVTGTGAARELYDFIEAEQTAANPLPNPNVPDADFDGTPAQWKDLIAPLIAKMKRSWVREALAHARALGGAISGNKPPPIAALTLHGAAGAVITEGVFGLHLSRVSDGAVQSVKAYEEAVAPPYTFTVGINPLVATVGSPYWGLILRAASNRLITFGLSYDPAIDGMRISVDQWTSATVYSSTPLAGSSGLGYVTRVFMRIQDDNTNHKFSWSFDGENFRELLSQSRTAWLADGGVARGIFVRAFSADTAFTAFSWDVTP